MIASSPAAHAIDTTSAAPVLAPRLAAVVLSALAVASLAYWGLRMSSVVIATSAPGAGATARLPEAADPDRVARLLAAPSARPAESAAAPVGGRLQLAGVVAGVSGRGTALIAVEGRPARPYPVGASVSEGLVVQSVLGRQAKLGPALKGPATVVLDLPPLPR